MAERRPGLNSSERRLHRARTVFLAATNPDGTLLVPWGSAQPRNGFSKETPKTINIEHERPPEVKTITVYEAQAAD